MSNVNKSELVRQFIAERGTSATADELRAYSMEKFKDPEFLPVQKYYKFRTAMQRGGQPQNGSPSPGTARINQTAVTRQILSKIGVYAERDDFNAYCVKNNIVGIDEKTFYTTRKRMQREKATATSGEIKISSGKYTPATAPQDETIGDPIIGCIRKGKELIRLVGSVSQAKELLEALGGD